MDALNQTETGLTANILYVIAGFLFFVGLSKRVGKKPPYRIILPIVIGIALQTWYFSLVMPNQLARIYLLNFSAGIVIMVFALANPPPRNALFPEQLVFWSLLLFGLHFFPRTILTVGFGVQMEPDDFMISSYWFTLQLCLAAFGAAVAISLLCACVYDTVATSAEERDRDRLTRLLSRRAFHQQSEAALEQSDSLPMCLAICDIDNFRRFNQHSGYEDGDRVMAEFGHLLSRAILRPNITGRYDGEEFLILLPRTKLPVGVETMKALMATIKGYDFRTDANLGPLTLSVGIVEIGMNETYSQALHRAQAALKSAEALGPHNLIAGTMHPSPQKEGPALGGAIQT